MDEMGEFATAEPLCQQSLNIMRKVNGCEHPATGRALYNLAVLYQSMGNSPKAAPLFDQAFHVLKKALGLDHPLTVSSLGALTFVKVALAQSDEARKLGQQYYKLSLGLLARILGFASEQDRLAYEHSVAPYSLLASIGGEDTLIADAVLHYKGIVLDSIVEDRVVAERSADQALVEELNTAKSQLGQLLLRSFACLE